MKFNIYLIDIYGNAHFLQSATDYKHANVCCDMYFDDLMTYGRIIFKGRCWENFEIHDIEMVRADKDPYKGEIEL